MYGISQLDNIVYVVLHQCAIIKTYTADTLSPLGEDIHVEGMREPQDIVVCRHDRQLYVADCDLFDSKHNCIWRVSVDDRSYVKWLTLSSTDTFLVNTLSLTSRHLLVTSSKSRTVRQYSTMNKELLCVVDLSQYVKRLRRAVETTHDTFVVFHKGTSQDELQWAVSELFRFCYVSQAAR